MGSRFPTVTRSASVSRGSPGSALVTKLVITVPGTVLASGSQSVNAARAHSETNTSPSSRGITSRSDDWIAGTCARHS